MKLYIYFITLIYLVTACEAPIKNNLHNLYGFWIRGDSAQVYHTISFINDTIAILDAQNPFKSTQIPNYYKNEEIYFPSDFYTYHPFKLIDDSLYITYNKKIPLYHSDPPKPIEELKDTLFSQKWIKIVPESPFHFFSSSLKCNISLPFSSQSKSIESLNLENARTLWIGKIKTKYEKLNFYSFDTDSSFIISANEQFITLDDVDDFITIEAEPFVIERFFVVLNFDKNTPQKLKNLVYDKACTVYPKKKIFISVFDTIQKNIGLKHFEN